MTFAEFERWLNYVHTFSPEAGLNPDITNLIASSVEGNSNNNGVGAILTGVDSAKVREQAQELVQTDPGDQRWCDDAWIDRFTASPANGLASVIGLIQTRVNWNPFNNVIENNNAFTDFVNLLLLNPFLSRNIIDQQTISFENKDYSSIISDIANLYVGLLPDQIQDIITNLRQMARAALSNASSRQTNTLFVQNVMQVQDSDILSFYLYFSTVEFTYHDGKHHFMKADATFNRIKLDFNAAIIWNRTTAVVVARLFYLDVNQWLDNNTTPVNSSVQPVNLCF